MKIVLIIAVCYAIFTTLFGSVKVNKKEVEGIFSRFFISLSISTIAALMFSLPIMGILYLFK